MRLNNLLRSARNLNHLFWVVGLSVVFSCTGDTGKSDEKKPLVFGWIPKAKDIKVFDTGHAGATLKATELGVTLRYDAPETIAAPNVGALQSAVVASMVADKVDGIGISCADPSVKDAIDAAVAAGIPTMTWDSDCIDSNRFAFIGIDNLKGGKNGADMLAKSMEAAIANGYTGILVARGGTGPNLAARYDGFRSELALLKMQARYADLHIIGDVTCAETATDCAANLEPIMAAVKNDTACPTGSAGFTLEPGEVSTEACKKIGGVFFVGLWYLLNYCSDSPPESSVTGCSAAGVATNGVPNWTDVSKNMAGTPGRKVVNVAFDTLEFQLDMMREDLLQGLMGQKYWGWGYDTVQMLYDRSTANAAFPSIVDSGIDYVCPNNVSLMKAKWVSGSFTQTLPDCQIGDLVVAQSQ